MIRVFLIVVALGVLLLAGGMIYLGMFPPNPPQHAVEKTLPNEKFQAQMPTQAQTPAPAQAQTPIQAQTQPPPVQPQVQTPAQPQTQTH